MRRGARRHHTPRRGTQASALAASDGQQHSGCLDSNNFLSTIDTPPGVPGVSKNQITLHSSQVIRNSKTILVSNAARRPPTPYAAQRQPRLITLAASDGQQHSGCLESKRFFPLLMRPQGSQGCQKFKNDFGLQ